MAKRRQHDAKGRTRQVDRFTNIPNFVLASDAVRTLQPSAFMVLMYMAMRCYGAKNNGQIVYGNRSGCLWLNPESQRWEEREIGAMTKSTVQRALAELQRRGLVMCTRPSSFSQKKLAREYRLSWIRTESEPATNEFLSFRDSGPKLKPRPIHGPVSNPIGPPVGSSPSRQSPKPPVQAHQRAYSLPNRPIHGPPCNHSNSDVADEAERDAINAAVIDIGTAVSEAVRGSVLVRGARALKGVSATAPAPELKAALKARLAARGAR